MAWAVDQATLGTNSSTGTASTIVLTTTNTVASGAYIFVVVGHFNASVTLSSIASSPSLTWEIVQTANNGGVRAALCWAAAPSGFASSSTITATYSGNTNERKIAASSFTGGSGSRGTPTTATGSTTGWSISPTLSGSDLAVAAASLDTNGTSTPDANSTELQDFAAGTASRSFLYYRIGGSTVGGTFSAAASWSASACSFAVAGGGGTTSHLLGCLGAGA